MSACDENFHITPNYLPQSDSMCQVMWTYSASKREQSRPANLARVVTDTQYVVIVFTILQELFLFYRSLLAYAWS